MKIPFHWKQSLGILLTLIVVFLATKLGGTFTLAFDGLSLFWPPNAILLSALLILDRKFGLVCIGLCFPMFLTAELWSGYSAKNAVLFSLANCIEAGGAFLILTNYLQTPYSFVGFYKFLVFLFTVILASLLGGVIGAYSIYILGGPYLQSLIRWVLGDCIAFLTLTPLILTLHEWPSSLRRIFRIGNFETVGVFGLLLFLLAISYGALGMETMRFVGIQVVAIGLVFYSAIRLGIKGVSISALLFSFIVLSLQLNGFGAFVDLPGESSIIWMQVYVLVVIFSSVSLTILIAERDAAFVSLERINVDLEALVTKRSKELLRSTKRLASAQKLEAIGKVTGGVAHDFNNLLAVIQSNVELTELTDHDVKHSKAMSSIKTAVESGSSLTHSLLAYSRKTNLSPQPTDVGKLIEERSSIFQRLLGETVVLTHEIERGLWSALIDSNRFDDVLLNFVVNARDAMPNGGELHIKAKNVGVGKLPVELIDSLDAAYFVLISVTDTGCGILPDILNKVFDPFFTTKEIGGGSGLGLSMAYGFAKQSNGHLAIDSNQGESTTVRLYLPRAEKAEKIIHKPENLEKRTDRETCRILVVEDQPALMEVCTQILTANGFTVVSAMNGREALVILEEKYPIDILFSDIILPGGMSGFDIQKEAKLLQPGIGTILTSGHTDLHATDNSQLIENTDILYKPYASRDLLDRIELILKSKTG